MNKLVLVFGLFALTVFFGVGVTAVQLATDSFLFPFESEESFDLDDLFDSGNGEEMYEFNEYQEDLGTEYIETSPEETEGASWTCFDGTVIDAAWTNDGECDCNDCSDEDNLYKCANGTVIDVAYLNDGDCDCGDSCEDEVDY